MNYRLTFRDAKKEDTEAEERVLEVEPYNIEKRGPYPRNAPNM